MVRMVCHVTHVTRMSVPHVEWQLLHQLLDGMRNQVNTRVLTDYRLFAREQQSARRRRGLSNAREK